MRTAHSPPQRLHQMDFCEFLAKTNDCRAAALYPPVILHPFAPFTPLRLRVKFHFSPAPPAR